MRCTCCNAVLTDYESTVRHAITKQFLELCGQCLKTIEAFIPTQVRNDLLSESDTTLTESLWDDDEYITDTSEDDGVEDYWNER